MNPLLKGRNYNLKQNLEAVHFVINVKR